MERKKLLFCATTPMNYAMFKPLHRRLRQDPRVELWFTAHHDHRGLYRTVGLENEQLVSHFWSKLRRYDMRICPSFYYERNNADVTVQIFHGCSLKNRAVHDKALAYDKLFLVGPYMRRKFIETWKLPEDDPRFEDIGMPKLDQFFDGSLNAGELKKRLNLDPNLPTVIYAPTRTTETSSSLQLFGRQIIEKVSAMPVNFLVKLHDRAYKQWKSSMQEDWEQILEQYRGHPRVRPVFDYDVVPYLYLSDLLISDISSVVNEFSLLDRPIVLIDVPRLIANYRRIEQKRGLAVCDLEQWGQSVGQLVKDMESLPQTVQHGLAHPEEKKDIRHEFARRFFFSPGTATDRALEKIYALLGLEPLRTVPGGTEHKP
jgi:hypothetical protein